MKMLIKSEYILLIFLFHDLKNARSNLKRFRMTKYILYKICRVIIICYVMNVGLYNNVMSLSVELLQQDIVVQSSRLMQCEISPS